MNKIARNWLACFAVLFLVACGLSNSPAGVVQSFYRNIEHGELTQAMGSLSDKNKILGEEKLRQILQAQSDNIHAQGGIERIDTVEDIRGEICNVQVKIRFKNGREGGDNIPLVKENGKWKIGAKSLF